MGQLRDYISLKVAPQGWKTKTEGKLRTRKAEHRGLEKALSNSRLAVNNITKMLMLCRPIKLFLECRTNKIPSRCTNSNSRRTAIKKVICPLSTKLCWKAPNLTSNLLENCQTIAKSATLMPFSWAK